MVYSKFCHTNLKTSPFSAGHIDFPNSKHKIRLKEVQRFFLLAGPSPDVFLLPHIPYEGKGVVYFLYISL